MSNADGTLSFASPAWRSHSLVQVISRQNACLCRLNVELLADELLSFIRAVVPQETAQEHFDDVLLQCSFLEKLFILHLKHVHAGRICSSVKKILNFLIGNREDVKSFLMKYLANENQYVTYAASQAIIRFLGSVREATVPVTFFVEMDVSFSEKLVESNLLEASSILLIIERTSMESAEKCPPSFPLEAKDCCSHVPVQPSTKPEIGNFWHLSISQAIPSLVTKITAADKVCESPETVVFLSQMLRIMLFSAQTDCHLQDVLSRTLPKLLLDTSASLSMSSIEILHKIFSRCDKSNDSCFESSKKASLCVKVLTILPTLVEKLPTHKESTQLRGFGGIFNLIQRNPAWSYSEFQNGGHLEVQRIILLYLSSLRLLSMYCSPQTDEHGLLVQSIRSLQTFCAANSSLTWECAPAFRCSEYLVSLFGDQDDALIEALENCLEIVSSLKRNGSGNDDVVGEMCNSHSEFYFFLRSVGLDYLVILDLLVANDTTFLSYLVKYLKLASSDVDNVMMTHQELSLHLSTEEACEVTRNLAKVRKSVVREEPMRDVGDLHRNLVGYDSSDDEVSDERTSSGQLVSVPISNDASASQKKMPSSLVQLVNLCSSLCMCIEKQMRSKLFPYNAKPLVRLLKAFNVCYNCTEFL